MHPSLISAAAHGGLAVWPLLQDVEFQMSRVEQVCPEFVHSKMLWFASVSGIPACFPSQVCLPLDIVILDHFSLLKLQNCELANPELAHQSKDHLATPGQFCFCTDVHVQSFSRKLASAS